MFKEPLRFTKLTKEQLGRLDYNLDIYPTQDLLDSQEPALQNVFHLLMSGDDLPTVEEIELASKTLETCSHTGIILLWTKMMRHSCKSLRERIQAFKGSIIPHIVRVTEPYAIMRRPFKEEVPSVRQRRLESYVGPALLRRTYVAKTHLLRGGNKFIQPGSTFEVLEFDDLEHGAVDALVQTAVHGLQRVILFPDEVNAFTYR